MKIIIEVDEKDKKNPIIMTPTGATSKQVIVKTLIACAVGANKSYDLEIGNLLKILLEEVSNINYGDVPSGLVKDLDDLEDFKLGINRQNIIEKSQNKLMWEIND